MWNITIFFIASYCCCQVLGHGMMVEPPSRSVLWKYYPVDNVRVLKNFKSNGIMCGGFKMQWNDLNGKCGVCGDPFNATHPQDNENTGKFGKFGPVRNYSAGDDISIKINITANHFGKFRYSLCVLDDPSKPESGEDCFKSLKLSDESNEYTIPNYFPKGVIITTLVQLPKDQKCERCVLRWEYIAGNKRGICDDGKRRKGCGPQSTFRNCADITIH